MKRSWRGRAIAASIVAITATLALAANGTNGDLTAVPRIIGIRHGQGSSATGAIMLVNNGTAFTVKNITYSCGNPGVQLQGGSGGSPFTIGAGASQAIVVECPAGLAPGLQRCNFTAHDMADLVVASFDGFCETDAMQKISATPPSATFSNAQLGVPTSPVIITIVNQDALDAVPGLQFQVDDDNFLVGSPCQNSLGCDGSGIAMGGSAHVDVLCKPLTTGSHTGHLFVVGTNGVALPAPIDLSCIAGSGSGSGSGLLTVTPPSVLIGGQIEVTGGSGQTTVVLRNVGSGSLRIESLPISDDGIVGAGSDWQVTVDGQCADTPCDLANQQFLNARVTFDPSGFNSRHAKMVVNYTDPSTKQQTVDLDGSGFGATLELIAGSNLEFGTIPVSTPSMMLSFTLRNQGNRPAVAMFSPATAAPFTYPSMISVAPGQQAVSVSCQSVTETDATQTLTINGSDAPAVPDAVAMHCNVKNTQITSNPSAIDLHEVRTGSTVTPIPIAITKVGGGSGLALDNPPVLAPADANLMVANLTPAMTPATTSLMVTPTMDRVIAPGTNITVTPAVGQALDIPVSGSVVTAMFTRSDVTSLGTFCVGQPTSSTSVSFSSTGTSHIMVNGVGLAAGTSSAFELTNGTPTSYPTSLDPLVGKATVVITPKRATAAGGKTDDVVWNTDAGSPTTPVTVNYIADGGAIAPGSLDFGATPIRIVADNDQQVTLQNCSATTLELIEPDVPEPFVLTGPFPTVLDPAGRATFSIAFRPTTVEHFDTTLTVESTDNMQFPVRLLGDGVSGTGTGGDDDGTADETSFYACGCNSRSSDPTGVLCVAAAVCGLLARRKRRRAG